MKKRFRSMNEFIPHAIWLMGNPSDDCECKYCAKKSQREITASMSTILRTTPTQSPMPSRIRNAKEKGKGRDPANRLKEARQRDTKAYAAVQKTVQPMKASAHVLKQPMLVERSNDLRGLYSKASISVPRWFREGEVVWCALDLPIRSGIGEGAPAIEYWPAIVDEVKLKSKTVPRSSNESAGAPQTSSPRASTSAVQLGFETDESERGPMLDPSDEPPPWTIHQSMRYKVQFLGISHSIIVDNGNVLPYQAYMPTNEIMQMLATFPVEKLDFDKASLSSFNPCPGPVPPSFADSVPAYAFALQIGSTLSSYWCLTDDYELRYSIPPTPKPQPQLPQPSSTLNSSLSQLPAPQSLQEVIEAASRHNAQVARNTKTSYYESVSAINAETSGVALNKTASRVLGNPPPPDQLAQTRFQGLWWGAERIWVDDFIRLKVPRRSLAPNGDNHILPPSGPGKVSLETWLTTSRDTTELGAGMRGVFLRLDGIVAVNVPTSTGMKPEARVCGMLYELADEDWVEPNELPVANGTSATTADPQPTPTPPSGPSTQPDSTPQNGLPSKVSNGVVAEPTNSGPPPAITMPPAPEGYKFRPILEAGYEFVGAMSLISGRYYPRLLSHPKMVPIVKQAMNQAIIEESNNLWALEGLSGGYFNSVDPVRYKKSRLVMLQDADKEATSELRTYQQARLAERQVVDASNQPADGEDAMDVDDIYA